jgi:hypothetical protein
MGLQVKLQILLFKIIRSMVRKIVVGNNGVGILLWGENCNNQILNNRFLILTGREFS